MPANYN